MWLELHRNGSKRLINMDQVHYVRDIQDTSARAWAELVFADEDGYAVDESYDEIRTMLALYVENFPAPFAGGTPMPEAPPRLLIEGS